MSGAYHNAWERESVAQSGLPGEPGGGKGEAVRCLTQPG